MVPSSYVPVVALRLVMYIPYTLYSTLRHNYHMFAIRDNFVRYTLIVNCSHRNLFYKTKCHYFIVFLCEHIQTHTNTLLKEPGCKKKHYNICHEQHCLGCFTVVTVGSQISTN